MDVLEPTADEAWVFACQVRGECADFETRAAPSGQRPVLRAEMLRRWILGLSLAEARPSSSYVPVGLHVRGAVIQGTLRLADASGSHGDSACAPLIFESCRFQADEGWPLPHERTEASVDLEHARCSRIAFIDCELASLALGDAWIGGDLDLTGLHAGEDGKQCWLKARGCRVQGSVTLSRASFCVEQSSNASDRSARGWDYACDLIGARVEGDLIGRDGLTVLGGLALPRLVGGDVVLDGARLVHTPETHNSALMGQSCNVGGVMSLRPQQSGTQVRRFECVGCIEMYGLTVGGTLTMSGAHLSHPSSDDTLIRAYLLDVRGSLLLDDWRPKAVDGAEPPDAIATRIAGGGFVDFRCANIGTDLFMSLEQEGVFHLLGGGMRVVGQALITRARHQLSIEALQVGRDLTLEAVRDAPPRVEAQDLRVGGNLWLRGPFGDLRAWGAQIQGEFGSRDYEAVNLVLGDVRVQGVSRLRASTSIFLEGAVLAGRVVITSRGKIPGIRIAADSLTTERDLQIHGPVHELLLAAARIEGRLDASACSVNTATLDGIRVQGGVMLPRNVFGQLSLVGGHFESWVRFEATRLHLRRRPTGDTRPGMDFRDARIAGDLQVLELERVPPAGLLEEIGATPAWIGQLTSPEAPEHVATLRMFRHPLSFYDNAEIVEFHLPAVDGLVEAHAFLLLGDGQTVYLNGDSSPIHRVNGLQGGKKPLKLNDEEQVKDYLRFFCGHVWSEDGAFVILDSDDETDWLHYAEKDSEKFEDLPAPPRVERDGEDWICHAVVSYADYLFLASFRVKATGFVDMTSDQHIARLVPQGVKYAKPHRQYPQLQQEPATPGQAPLPHTPHRLIVNATAWEPLEDVAMRAARINRVRAALTTTSKQLVAADQHWPVLIDLRGCRCGSLEDDHGRGWSAGLTADLRGFEYADLTEGAASRRREANAAFAGPGLSADDAMGTELGQLRYRWMERMTQGLAFSVAPYEQLVRALAGRGDQEAARTVLERRLQQENAQRRWLTRWSIWLGVQLPFRFGLFSRRGLVATLLYWLLGIIAFDVANYGQLRFPPVGAANSRLIVGSLALPLTPVLVVDSQPVTMGVMSSEGGQKLVSFKLVAAEAQAEEVSCGDQIEPSIYALDVMLPLVDLHQEAKCAISAADGWGPFAWRAFRALYALGGAYMTSMLILTLSGVLRRSIER